MGSGHKNRKPAKLPVSGRYGGWVNKIVVVANERYGRYLTGNVMVAGRSRVSPRVCDWMAISGSEGEIWEYGNHNGRSGHYGCRVC